MCLHFRGHIEASPLCLFSFFFQELILYFQHSLSRSPTSSVQNPQRSAALQGPVEQRASPAPLSISLASHASLRGRLMGSSSFPIAHCTGCLGLVPPAPPPHLLSPAALTWLSSLSSINQTSLSCSYDPGHRDRRVQGVRGDEISEQGFPETIKSLEFEKPKSWLSVKVRYIKCR